MKKRYKIIKKQYKKKAQMPVVNMIADIFACIIIIKIIVPNKYIGLF
jgi:hypothetical protein